MQAGQGKIQKSTADCYNQLANECRHPHAGILNLLDEDVANLSQFEISPIKPVDEIDYEADIQSQNDETNLFTDIMIEEDDVFLQAQSEPQHSDHEDSSDGMNSSNGLKNSHSSFRR